MSRRADVVWLNVWSLVFSEILHSGRKAIVALLSFGHLVLFLFSIFAPRLCWQVKLSSFLTVSPFSFLLLVFVLVMFLLLARPVSRCNLKPQCEKTSSVQHLSNQAINSLHPNVSMNILHTVLCVFCISLTRRICLSIKSFFRWQSCSLF